MKNEQPCYDIENQKPNHCFACKEKFKKAAQCEFCAMKFCNDCRVRLRPFPNSITFENGEKLMGKICKICDRKFLMLDQFKSQVSASFFCPFLPFMTIIIIGYICRFNLLRTGMKT